MNCFLRRNQIQQEENQHRQAHLRQGRTAAQPSHRDCQRNQCKVSPVCFNSHNKINLPRSRRSMTDLVSDSSQQTSSPKRKFSFRFPHIHGHHHGSGGGGGGTGSGGSSGSGGVPLKSDQHGSMGSGSGSGGVLGGSGGGGGGGPSGSGSGSRGSGSDKDHLASGSGSSSGHHHHHHGTGTLSSAYRERRNFSEEAKNVPDLHVSDFFGISFIIC